jgi:hypothetical protein
MEQSTRIGGACDDHGTSYAVYAADGELEDSDKDLAPLVKRLADGFGDTTESLFIILP